MLSNQAYGVNSKDDADDDVAAYATKRSSVFKKTMKAFGKVKPMFKGGKNKKTKMELFESCGDLEFDFDVDGEDFAQDDVDSEEEVETVVESNEKPEPPKAPDTPKTETCSEIAEEEGEEQEEDRIAELTPPSSPPPQVQQGMLKGTTMIGNASNEPQNDNTKPVTSDEVTAENIAESASPRKPSSGRKLRSSSKRADYVSPRSSKRKPAVSPVPKKGPLPTSPRFSPKPHSKLSPGAPKISPKPHSPKSKGRSSSRKLPSSKDLDASVGDLLPSATGVKDKSVEPAMLSIRNLDALEVDKVGDNEESLRRLSNAFGNDSALGGYFTKLQEKKEPSKPNLSSLVNERSPEFSSSLVFGTGDDQIVVPASLNIDDLNSPKKKDSADVDESHQKKGDHAFKSSKRIKNLFKGGKSSKESGKSEEIERRGSETGKSSSVSDDTDQANTLMEELANMLSPATHDVPQKPKAVVHRKVLDDSDHSALSEFPEIPTEKKTSLSDIRRMMSAPADDVLTSPRIGGRKFRREQSKPAPDIVDNKEAETQAPPLPSSNEPAPEDPSDVKHAERQERQRRPGSRRTLVKATEDTIPEDSELQREAPRQKPEGRAQSPRRHRKRTSRRGSADTSSGETKSRDATESDGPSGDGNVDKHTTQGWERHGRRRGSRRSGETSGTQPRSTTQNADDAEGNPDSSTTTAPTDGTSSASRNRRADRLRNSNPSGGGSNSQLPATEDATDNKQDVGAIGAIAPESETPMSPSKNRRSHKRSSDKSSANPSMDAPKVDKRDSNTSSGSSRPRRSHRRTTDRTSSSGEKEENKSSEAQESGESTSSNTRRSRPSYKMRAPSERNLLADRRSLNVRSLSMGNFDKRRGGFEPMKKHVSGRAMRTSLISPIDEHLETKNAQKESMNGCDESTSTPPGEDSGGAERKEQESQSSMNDSSNKETPTKDAEDESMDKFTEMRRKPNKMSLAETFERQSGTKLRLFDETSVSQETISTDDGSEMFVKGQVSYSCIKTSEKLSAPQLVFDAPNAKDGSLEVKNA